ncbi:MAG: polynucleotide 5'-hydroxyl-kinase [Nitrospirota bacterium]
MEIKTGTGWREAADWLGTCRGTVFLLGRTDTGKSTLARYLVYELLRKGKSVALVDGDVGQSILAIPGTIAMKAFSISDDLKMPEPDSIFFVGTANPVKRIGLVIEGMSRMVAAARRRKVHTVIVDTTGLVDGGLGRTLKFAEINAVRPDAIIALQMHEELEHILARVCVDATRVFRFRPSVHIRKRRGGTRKVYRRRKIKEYFRDAETIHIRLGGLELRYGKELISLKDFDMPRGTLLGLNRGDMTVSIGLFEKVQDHNSLCVRARPAKGPLRIDRVLIGDPAC